MTNHRIIKAEVEALHNLCLECKKRIEDIRNRRANGATMEDLGEFELSEDFFSRPLVMIIRKKTSSYEDTEKKQPTSETGTTTDSPKAKNFRKEAIRTHSARWSAIIKHHEWREIPRFVRGVLKTLWLYLRILMTRSDALAIVAFQELVRISITHSRLPGRV